MIVRERERERPAKSTGDSSWHLYASKSTFLLQNPPAQYLEEKTYEQCIEMRLGERFRSSQSLQTEMSKCIHSLERKVYCRLAAEKPASA